MLVLSSSTERETDGGMEGGEMKEEDGWIQKEEVIHQHASNIQTRCSTTTRTARLEEDGDLDGSQ